MQQEALEEIIAKFEREHLAPNYAVGDPQWLAATEAMAWLKRNISLLISQEKKAALAAVDTLTANVPLAEMSSDSRSDLLQLKALRVLIEAQNLALPTAAFNTPVQHQLALVAHQLDSEIENLEATGHRTGLDHLQRQAIARYGAYGLLIEELRDAANGALPPMFTEIGNLLARYRDFEPEQRDLECWIWTLESMKSAVESELEAKKQDLYSRRGV